MKTLLSLSLIVLAARSAPAADWSQLSGQFSRIDSARAVVVRSDADWRRLWAEHAEGGTRLTPPPVDFTKEAVVAVFSGERRTAGCEVRPSLRPDGSGKGLVALYWVERRAADGFAADVLSRPFLFQKVARPDGPLELEEAEGAPARPGAARREGFRREGERLGILEKALVSGGLFGRGL